MHEPHHWYLSRSGQRFGPVPTEQICQWVASGRVAPNDMLIRSDATAWAPAIQFQDLAAHWPSDDPTRWAGANAQGYGWAGRFAGYAGYWKRFGALIIDNIVLTAPFVLIHLLLGLNSGTGNLASEEGEPVTSLILMTVTWLYHACMEASPAQGSIGKLALNIKVTDMQGRPLSFGRALARQVAKLIWYPTLGIGGIMIGFTEFRQGLHDMIARTLVVNR